MTHGFGAARVSPTYLEQMHARCHEFAGVILVAANSGEIAGLAMVLTRVPFEQLDQPPGDYAILAELIVREGYRRHSIGAQLLKRAEQYAQDAGARELRISVLSGNAGARQLYLREGFLPYSETLSKAITSAAVCHES